MFGQSLLPHYLKWQVKASAEVSVNKWLDKENLACVHKGVSFSNKVE